MQLITVKTYISRERKSSCRLVRYDFDYLWCNGMSERV